MSGSLTLENLLKVWGCYEGYLVSAGAAQPTALDQAERILGFPWPSTTFLLSFLHQCAAAGLMDTEIGCFMEPEVGHAET